LNQYKNEAIMIIERELQIRRQEYVATQRRKHRIRLKNAMGLDIADPKPLVSMFTPPVITKDRLLLTEKERSDSLVPDDMKQWIFRPEISAIFTEQHQ